MHEAIVGAFAVVFRLAPEQVTDELSPDTFDDWDSLSHLRLVSALEERLSLTFGNDEIMDMVSVAGVRDVLSRRGISA